MNTIRYINKTVVDGNNIMWMMDLDRSDNTVAITSDYAVQGSFAILSQYSMDNDTGQDIPDSIVASAMEMIEQDSVHRFNDILDQYAEPKRVQA